MSEYCATLFGLHALSPPSLEISARTVESASQKAKGPGRTQSEEARTSATPVFHLGRAFLGSTRAMGLEPPQRVAARPRGGAGAAEGRGERLARVFGNDGDAPVKHHDDASRLADAPDGHRGEDPEDATRVHEETRVIPPARAMRRRVASTGPATAAVGWRTARPKTPERRFERPTTFREMRTTRPRRPRAPVRARPAPPGTRSPRRASIACSCTRGSGRRSARGRRARAGAACWTRPTSGRRPSRRTSGRKTRVFSSRMTVVVSRRRARFRPRTRHREATGLATTGAARSRRRPARRSGGPPAGASPSPPCAAATEPKRRREPRRARRA